MTSTLCCSARRNVPSARTAGSSSREFWLYVCTGGFIREARYEADRSNVPVRCSTSMASCGSTWSPTSAPTRTPARCCRSRASGGLRRACRTVIAFPRRSTCQTKNLASRRRCQLRGPNPLAPMRCAGTPEAPTRRLCPRGRAGVRGEQEKEGCRRESPS